MWGTYSTLSIVEFSLFFLHLSESFAEYLNLGMTSLIMQYAQLEKLLGVNMRAVYVLKRSECSERFFANTKRVCTSFAFCPFLVLRVWCYFLLIFSLPHWFALVISPLASMQLSDYLIILVCSTMSCSGSTLFFSLCCGKKLANDDGGGGDYTVATTII